MIAVRLLWLAVLLVAIPAWVGNCFLNVDKPCRNPVFLWISGQMLLWAGFQVICVPVILLEGRMWMVTVAYCGYILVLLAAATVRYFRQSRTLRAVREAKPEKAEIILWVLAGVLLLVQPYKFRQTSFLFEASLKNSLSPCPLCGSASPDSPPGERQIFPSHIYCHQQ